MWTSDADQLDSKTTRYRLQRDGHELTYSDVLKGWIADSDFRAFFTQILVEAKPPAFRWETPAVTRSTINRMFEFVLIDSPALERPVDPTAFDNQFRAHKSGSSVIAFSNLSGDAQMIVPRPLGDAAVYGHLASFVRGAQAKQIDDLWKLVGETLAKRLDETPVWLSTAGMGVSWLHVRLDNRPKYYGHRPYRTM
ncbi:MAG: hypothetical protein KDA93_21405 [Planctomycetaceae bacterium]|nr:hypothetical protein [Planctomycetaceae bacterium]